jgi:hypothetical protein
MVKKFFFVSFEETEYVIGSGGITAAIFIDYFEVFLIIECSVIGVVKTVHGVVLLDFFPDERILDQIIEVVSEVGLAGSVLF